MFLLAKMLREIVRRGQLIAIEANGKVHRFGTPEPGWATIRIRFTDARTPNYMARHPRLGIGESYMNGKIVIEQGDIRSLIALIRANAPWEAGSDGLDGPFRRSTRRVFGVLNQINTIGRSKRNVAHHYDLSDRLYDLFLDADKQYSCAYFTDPANPLEQAQLDKKAHIAAKLHLRPGLRVLDIGCGWGGLALYLNRVADVDVLGVTLSEEQLKVARRRAAEAGVADRVKFELIDYRKLTGTFDRIISVGMFEHVGVPQYRTFFAKCRALLAQDGVMLLHTIGRMGGPGFTDAFTTKYIFPGGYNPALSEIVTASEQARMIVADIETLRLHYALTINHWYDRTVAAKDAIVALYDERFYRMWTFYLAGAISAFRYGGLVNYQLQYIRERRTLPITRDYLADDERALRATV